MTIPTLDLGQLRELLAPLVVEALQGLFESGIGDLKAYGREIARDFVRVEVLRLSDPERALDLETALLGQIRVLAEVNRLRLCQGSWDLVGRIARVLARAIVAGALVALGERP